MSADANEHYYTTMLSKYCSVIASYVDATATGETFIHRMIVQEWVETIYEKEILARHKLDAYFLWYLLEIFEKRTVQIYLHDDYNSRETSDNRPSLYWY